jgi:hypothetical protein
MQEEETTQQIHLKMGEMYECTAKTEKPTELAQTEKRLSFIWRKCLVQISAGTSYISTGIFVALFKPFGHMVIIVPFLVHDIFLHILSNQWFMYYTRKQILLLLLHFSPIREPFCSMNDKG